MKKKIALLTFFSALSLSLIGFSHYYELPLYEWSRLTLALPVILAGIYFRRAGSFTTMYILILFQGPFILIQYERNQRWGANYGVGIMAVGIIAIFLGHVIRKGQEDKEAISSAHRIIEGLRGDVDEEALLNSLEQSFREHAATDSVALFVFDEHGALKRRGADESPLPSGHLFYKIAESNSYFISKFPPEDIRIAFTGGPDENPPGLLAVFPLRRSGRVFGVAALADPAVEQFGSENVSFLTTISGAVESLLDIIEKKRTAMLHRMQHLRIRDMFSSYVSRSVAEQILKDPSRLDLGGAMHDVTVMFTEVANFREILATLSPEDALSMLNRYFSAAIDTVFEHDGTLDKFIGDNVMAFWGAPLAMPDVEKRAAACASALAKRIQALNSEWAGQGRPEFNVRIGLNSGRVVAGNVGGIRRMEYTVIGDTVNTASRIKALSKTSGIPILVGESTWEKVRDNHKFGEPIAAELKGKTEAVTVYPLLD